MAWKIDNRSIPHVVFLSRWDWEGPHAIVMSDDPEHSKLIAQAPAMRDALQQALQNKPGWEKLAEQCIVETYSIGETDDVQ